MTKEIRSVFVRLVDDGDQGRADEIIGRAYDDSLFSLVSLDGGGGATLSTTTYPILFFGGGGPTFVSLSGLVLVW